MKTIAELLVWIDAHFETRMGRPGAYDTDATHPYVTLLMAAWDEPSVIEEFAAVLRANAFPGEKRKLVWRVMPAIQDCAGHAVKLRVRLFFDDDKPYHWGRALREEVPPTRTLQ